MSNFDTIKLEKGLYTQKKSFTGALEAPLAPLVGWRFALASRAWLALLLAALSLVLVA